MKFTILGSTGFIGSNLLRYYVSKGIECDVIDLRHESIPTHSLDHVLYAIGIPNFKEHPFDTVESHVCLLKKFLEKANFESFLYLDSTRIYQNSIKTTEDSSIIVNPTNLDHLYNISKIMGESICFASSKPNVRIARLSNVTGNAFTSSLFLPTILRDAVDKGKISIRSSLNSEKDYVYIDDVAKIIQDICLRGKENIYNIASGKNIKTNEIIDKLVNITHCSVEVSENAQEYSFSPISIGKIKNEFNFKPISILDKIDGIVSDYKKFKLEKN